MAEQEFEPKPLARGPLGEAIIAQDQDGELRYLYSDGSLDSRSRVDNRNPTIEVAGQIAIERAQELAPVPELERTS